MTFGMMFGARPPVTEEWSTDDDDDCDADFDDDDDEDEDYLIEDGHLLAPGGPLPLPALPVHDAHSHPSSSFLSSAYSNGALPGPPNYRSSSNVRPSIRSSNGNAVEKRKIIGQCMLGKTIGEGTFGKVKLAIHIPTGEKVTKIFILYYTCVVFSKINAINTYNFLY